MCVCVVLLLKFIIVLFITVAEEGDVTGAGGTVYGPKVGLVPGGAVQECGRRAEGSPAGRRLRFDDRMRVKAMHTAKTRVGQLRLHAAFT